VHQLRAGSVFAMLQLQCISRGAQRCRQPVRPAHRLDANMMFDRNERPIVAGVQHMPLNGALESSGMRRYAPARIRRSFKEFLRH
jgi:hypothetical protein